MAFVSKGVGLTLYCFLSLEGGHMPHGTIKKIVSDKGFGFIGGERGDVFFHHPAWHRDAACTLAFEDDRKWVST